MTKVFFQRLQSTCLLLVNACKLLVILNSKCSACLLNKYVLHEMVKNNFLKEESVQQILSIVSTSFQQGSPLARLKQNPYIVFKVLKVYLI